MGSRFRTLREKIVSHYDYRVYSHHHHHHHHHHRHRHRQRRRRPCR